MNYTLTDLEQSKFQNLFLDNYKSPLEDLSKSYWLYGNSATGKTTAAIEFATRWTIDKSPNFNLDISLEEIRDKFTIPYFISERQLTELFYTKNDQSDLKTKKYHTRELLAITDRLVVIDDLGFSQNNQFAKNEISQFLKTRFENKLQTVVTTNLVGNKLTDLYDTRLFAHLQLRVQDGSLQKINARDIIRQSLNFDINKFKKPEPAHKTTPEAQNPSLERQKGVMRGICQRNPKLARELARNNSQANFWKSYIKQVTN
jgi:hypothetical protein